MENGGSFRLEVRRGGRVISRSDRQNARGGWSTFDFGASMSPPLVRGSAPYTLHLVNTSGGVKTVKELTIHYW